jgi:hypothetical protein
LWVTDFKRKKQWPSNPPNAGHRRDFYRATDPQLDPLYFETMFSRIEDSIAPVLKAVDQQQEEPGVEELDRLLSFAAVMFARVPAFRPFILKVTGDAHRAWLSNSLESPEAWAKALDEIGMPRDTPGASYEAMRKIDMGDYSLSAENEWYLYHGFKAADQIIPILETRHWTTQISPSGSFIASDNPVMLDGPPQQEVGFGSAEVVMFPVSRHVLLCGTSVPVFTPPITRRRIATHNTFTMLRAEEQVYSYCADFCWLDETGKYQTDWTLFSREKFDKALGNGIDFGACTFFQRR